MSDLLKRFVSRETVSVKVCGLRDLESAEMLIEEGVDALGVNFWERSKRYLSLDEAKQWLPKVEGRILRVGLFVNHSMDFVERVWEAGILDVVQLHGDESLASFQYLRQRGIPVWRAAGVKDASSLEGLKADLTEADAWLLDAHAPGVFGGTGQTLDWDLAGAFVSENTGVSWILAGGLKPENVREAIEAVRPSAVDLASGVESAPAVKERPLVKALMNEVRGDTSVESR